MQFWTGKAKRAQARLGPLWTAITLVASLTPMVVDAASPRPAMFPFVKLGPQATLSSASGPKYNLFTCQLVALNTSVTCYDPYQIRHAYHTDLLIGSGFDGKGKTIVIIDAYQSPNILLQLNFYNAFYGLPSLNGLGAPPNPALGTFTQVAPH